MEVTEKATAKINLAQDVYNQEDGSFRYNNVMTSIDLSDIVTITESSGHAITIETTRSYLPDNERNYAFQAASLVRQKVETDQGLHIFIHKQIPVAAGLGGGSSDAAAVIRGLNRLWNLHLSTNEMIAIGLEIDDDVPYTLVGGTCSVRGKGDEISRLPKLPSFWVVLAKPPISISTKRVLKAFKERGQTSQPNYQSVVDALYEQDYNLLMTAIGNSVESLTFSLYPELRKLKERMQNYGAKGVVMTGTGSTIIGFCQSKKKALQIYNALRGFCSEVYVKTLDQTARLPLD